MLVKNSEKINEKLVKKSVTHEQLQTYLKFIRDIVYEFVSVQNLIHAVCASF